MEQFLKQKFEVEVNEHLSVGFPANVRAMLRYVNKKRDFELSMPTNSSRRQTFNYKLLDRVTFINQEDESL